MLVFHVATEREWSATPAEGSYDRSTRDLGLAEVGFIHCAFREQIAKVLEDFYAGIAEPLVLLSIDTERTSAACVVEGGFPHLYGALPRDAVVDTTPLTNYLTYEIG